MLRSFYVCNRCNYVPYSISAFAVTSSNVHGTKVLRKVAEVGFNRGVKLEASKHRMWNI